MSKVTVRTILSVCLTSLIYINAHALDSDYVITTGANEIKIMSYNAENLFDAEHDAGKHDWEFLPKSSPEKKNCPQTGHFTSAASNEKPPAYNPCLTTDWTDAKVEMKLAQIKKVVDAAGSLPDILTLCEVENQKVITRLAKELGYDGFYMTTSPDVRGIDLAILYKTAKLQPLGFKEKEIDHAFSLTRNLSVGHFRIKGSVGADGILAIYPNHWPSQMNPTKARLIVAEQQKAFVEENKDLYRGENYYIVLTGDFNTTLEDSPNPLADVLMTSPENLLDSRLLSNASRNPAKSRMPQGTYYYGAKKQWNELDHIYVGSNLNDKQGLEIDPTSFRVHAPSFITKKNDAGDDVPFRYNHNTMNPAFLGYSDHFALTVKLKAVKAKSKTF